MPRKNRTNQDAFPYHIYNRSNNKEDFPLVGQSAWKLWNELIFETQFRYDIKVHGFVLMRNHYHLMASTPNANLSEAMWFLHKEMSEAFNRQTSKINHRFGSQYKATLIKHPEHLAIVLRYIYQNPMRAGICSEARHYPWSTLHGQLGYSRLSIPLSPCAMAPSFWTCHPDLIQSWVNTCAIDPQAINMSLALSRNEFKIPRPKSLHLQKIIKNEMKLLPIAAV